MFSLTVEKGEPAGAVFALQEGESTLGRSRSATFRLLSQDVSGVHARVVVGNGEARLENLSQFGTRLDGTPVTAPVALRPGQRIELGKATVLVFRQEEPARSAPDRAVAEAATGEAPPAVTRADAVPAQVPPPAVTHDEFSELTRAASGTAWGAEEGATEGATRAMQTRAAAPEEIEHLKAAEQKRLRRRTTIGIGVAIPVLLLAVLFRPRTPPPETEIEWAKDAAGDYADRFEPAPGGGFKDGGYDLCYPGNNTFKRKAAEGGLVLEGWIARKLDVPMRIILQEEQEVRFASMTRAAAIEDWMAQASASGGRWNFDRPSPTPAFLGKKNGVPFTRITYLRDGDGTWFGVASVVRHGCRRIVTRAEVPATERVRAEKMMSSKLLRVSEEFEYAYWEGGPLAAPLAEQEVLANVRADLERIAPATWVALEGLLRSLLIQTSQNGHKEIAAEAGRLLVRLRERQALWFNSQQLAFDAALMQNNVVKASKTAEFTKAVFSNIEDQRYFTVRKWRAAPQ